MASGMIKKPSGFSTFERITAFPFTPTHSGIVTLLIGRADPNTGWVERKVKISEDNAVRYEFTCVFYSAWEATQVTFPVIAGRTYSITAGSTYVTLADDRSAFTY